MQAAQQEIPLPDAARHAASPPKVDVINLVSDDDRTPVRRPRPVKPCAELQIVAEQLTYTETTTSDASRRRARSRPPLLGVDANQQVVTNFEPGTTDKDVCLLQHVERFDPVKHYVHPRPACGTFAFADDSRKFCSKCYCLVCEIPAAECPSWDVHRAIEF